MSMDFDILIIGGGAAGKDAAFLAARAGLNTLLIEKEKLGGTSYHRGSYMIRALQMCAQSFRASEFSEKNPANMGIGYGYITQGWSDWSKVRLDVTGRLMKELEEELAKSEIPVKMGSAKFLDNHTVQISSSGGTLEKVTADNIIIATGSEVGIAAEAVRASAAKGRKIRLVSMPSTNTFDAQDDAYKRSVLPPSVTRRVAVEAGVTGFWWHYVGLQGEIVGIDHFGASAPAKDLFKAYGFTAEHVGEAIEKVLAKSGA